jgi:uncharacterized MAPEG superfamily protein
MWYITCLHVLILYCQHIAFTAIVLCRQVSRQRDARTKRETATQDRVAAAQQKEDDARAAFMAQMGLQAGQKITIKPRES